MHIAAVPADLSRHYPGGYYSFLPTRRRHPGVPLLRKLWSHWVVSSPDPLAVAIARRLARGRYAFLQWARLARARLDSGILDVGCGSGNWLRRMQRYGFTRLAGVDPFAPDEIDEEGLSIKKTELSAVAEKFDLIMMNHVLEHIADPAAALTQARHRLTPGGRIVVRVPVAKSFLHREYDAAWYNLDAPRHLFIPSLAGMAHLAERTQLRILHRGFDSQEISLWASDKYRRGISGPNFPRIDLDELRLRPRIRQLDAAGDGDFGVFVLAPV